jgi:hypothetical protein
MVDAPWPTSINTWPRIRLSDGRGIQEKAECPHPEHRRSLESSSKPGSLRALIALSHNSWPSDWYMSVNGVDIEKLTNPTVKAAIKALQKGHKHSWASLFELGATLYDDGTPRSLASFTERALGHERFTSIDRVENRGLNLTGEFHSERWGDFRTYFRFHLRSNGKITRLDIGQAS